MTTTKRPMASRAKAPKALRVEIRGTAATALLAAAKRHSMTPTAVAQLWLSNAHRCAYCSGDMQ